MANGIIGGANEGPGRPRRPKPLTPLAPTPRQQVNTAPAPRPAPKEISTQTPSELRRLMKRQQGKARGLLKSDRKIYSQG